MVRDFDLIREIMIKIQEKPAEAKKFNLMIDGSIPEVNANIEYLLDAGFIDGRKESENNNDCTKFCLKRLTLEGQEFIDSIKAQNKWDKIKSIVNASDESPTLFLIQKIAQEISLEGIMTCEVDKNNMQKL